MATMFTTLHGSSFKVPKFISRNYINDRQWTLEGKLCAQTFELTNDIALLCSHSIIKTDELTCIHAGIILLVNLGACGHKLRLKGYTNDQ